MQGFGLPNPYPYPCHSLCMHGSRWGGKEGGEEGGGGEEDGELEDGNSTSSQ